MLAQLWWSCCQGWSCLGWSRRGGGSLFSWTVLWVGMGLSSLVRGDLGVCLLVVSSVVVLFITWSRLLILVDVLL